MTPSCDRLDFRLIEDAEELVKFEGSWRSLLSASFRHDPMLDPHWSLTWWRHYGGNRDIAVGVFSRENAVVGLAPLCRRHFRYRMGLRFRRLEFIGAGYDEADGVCSDYLGLIVRVSDEQAVADAFVRRLLDNSFGAWDECVLEMVDKHLPVLPPLRAALEAAGLGVEETPMTRAPFVSLPGDWTAYLKSLVKKRRQSITHALRDFEAWAGPGGYSWQQATDASSLEQGLGVLSALHAERWNADSLPGAFVSPRFAAFHADYAARLLRDGALELAWLSVRGQPVAAIYCILGSRKVYFYQSGRKMDVPAKVRPGIVMLALTMQRAIEKGFEEFDFLGGESQYKALFATGCRDLIRFRVARPTLRENARILLKSARDRMRKIS